MMENASVYQFRDQEHQLVAVSPSLCHIGLLVRWGQTARQQVFLEEEE
jgi:hypothetical protein